MAHLSIFIAGISRGTGVLNVAGEALTSDMASGAGAIGWSVDVADNASEANVIALIVDAAKNAAEAAGHNVGVLDKKRIFASVTAA